MLKTLTIRSLYTLALAEGEGVGTAYEYFVKRLLLRPWLRAIGRPRRILIAGLPQKYGASLDFLQIAAETGARVTVVDERRSALHHHWDAWQAAVERDRLRAVYPTLVEVDSIVELAPLRARYDLCLSSEVLQRLPQAEQGLYTARLRQLGAAVAIFAPNADNPAHTSVSGLAGVTRGEMNRLIAATAAVPGRPLPQTGYLDLPPFPPGITRTDEQREHAESGLLEATVMTGLEFYARLERLLPLFVRRQQAHIVYALLCGEAR